MFTFFRIDDFADCHVNSHIPANNITKLYEILNDMSESLYLLRQENCDLNSK